MGTAPAAAAAAAAAATAENSAGRGRGPGPRPLAAKGGTTVMQLTKTHLRYLLAIEELA